MGLKIHSLYALPDDYSREYYVYLLDYGWNEPLGNALRNNYDKFSTLASKAKNAVLLMQTEDGVEFNDEVLSWHGINGDKDPSLLPAILITNRHPGVFRERAHGRARVEEENDLKLILIPLKRHCHTTAQVIELIQKIFSQISAGVGLEHFAITEERKKGHGDAIVDSILVEPTEESITIPLETLRNFLSSGHIKPGVRKMVMPIHFEDYSGQQFERLVFAYLFREKNWENVYWLGETGGDGGRDIWGIYKSESYCYQCANYRALTFKKLKEDIDKLVDNNTIPNYFTLVCGGTITNGIRAQAIEYAKSQLSGLSAVDVWSGSEFEERLYAKTPELFRRFVEGQPFPETNASLKAFLEIVEAPTDKPILDFIAECLDRPAFTTPFRREVSIPDFGKAITDTIEVLNTGIHRLRDGILIRRGPSRHAAQDHKVRIGLENITTLVVALRDELAAFIKSKDIQPCGCKDADCPVYSMSDRACERMDNIRTQILDNFRKLKPDFNIRIR